MKRKKYFFKKVALFIFLLFLTAYHFASPAYAADKQRIEAFEVTTSVEISNNNLFNARKIAIKKCQTEAVKQALYKIMSEKAGTYETETLKAEIYNNPEQFFKSYKVLYETSYNKYYTVTTSIEVLSYNLLNKLNITETETENNNLSKIKIIAETDKSIETSSSQTETGEMIKSQIYAQNISSSAYDKLYYFAKFNEKLNAIKNIEQAVITEMMPNKRKFLTSFKGSADELADALMLTDFDAFKISIDKIEADILKVKITKQP
ncbi:MAG: hypothetical protein JRJ44_00310 [Deltaproteobacteria bacterium]|nr:hypothetical protein [Deltaproteobacteria bacterium]